MKIGIMGAMIEEVNLLQSSLTNMSSVNIGSRTYFSGMLFGIPTTLAFSRWGKVAAASTATTLITKFNIDLLIFTGIAGAISSKLNIGDIIIADRLYQHDMDTRPIFDKHEIPLLGTTFFNVDKDLLLKLEQAANGFTKKDLRHIINIDALRSFSLEDPKVYKGIIASGDQFIADSIKRNTILHEVPETLAVEMEGAAVAQVCYEHKIPFAVIRTISDKADHDAPIDFQRFIDEVSTHFSQHIVQNLYELLK